MGELESFSELKGGKLFGLIPLSVVKPNDVFSSVIHMDLWAGHIIVCKE